MTDTVQPVAGSLAAVVLRACQHPECKHYKSTSCPDHARSEDLGVVASFDNRKEIPADGTR